MFSFVTIEWKYQFSYIEFVKNELINNCSILNSTLHCLSSASDLADLEAKENRLDEMISMATRVLKETTENPANSRHAYVTYQVS